MTKLLWISDLTDTGYSSASKVLLNPLLKLRKPEDIYVFAINHTLTTESIKQVIKRDIPSININNIFTIQANPLLIDSHNDDNMKQYFSHMVGALDLRKILNTVKPDIVFTINDNEPVHRHLQIVKFYNERNNANIKTIGYVPIDCRKFPKGFFRNINDADIILTMTEFGKREIVKTGIDENKVMVLNHAININKFIPLSASEIKRQKIKLLGERFKNYFVILNANANQERKRIDLTLRIFFEYRRKYNNRAFLILKMSKNMSSSNGGIQLMDELNKYTPNDQWKNFVKIIDEKIPIDELNALFNIADVNINTSRGEGWGIIPCEGALTKRIQLVPNATSYPEIFKEVPEVLVDTEEIFRKPLGVGSNGYIPICTIFYDPVIKNKPELVLSLDNDSIPVVIIAPSGTKVGKTLNINGVETSVMAVTDNILSLRKQLFDLMEKETVLYKCIIICYTGKNLSFVYNQLKQLNEKSILDGMKNEEEYNVKQLKLDGFERSMVLSDIPKVDNFVEKLHYIQKLSKDEYRELGEKLRNTIVTKYSPMTITSQLNTIINNLNGNGDVEIEL